jgi:glycerol kinase
MAEYVAALDQGTTGTRCMLFDREGGVVADAYERHEQRYPQPGWVEHDAAEILSNAKRATTSALEAADASGGDLVAIGVTNQRETTVLWDRETGEPVHNAIVWQDRRTADRIESLGEEAAAYIRETTGLQPDAYFSASKIEWLLNNATVEIVRQEESLRERAASGDVVFGTIDAWLIERLTGAHVTDVTNASRTMLFDIHDLAWDDRLLAEFEVPRGMLPEVRPSSDDTPYGHTDPDGFLGATVPVTAALGDQQAALFGQACFDAGDVKNTYGTGSFVLLNTGHEAVESEHGLLTTVGFQRAGEAPCYALEGSIFVTGAAIEWLEEVDLIDDPAETAALARSVESTDGVYVVPAFTGLGAPHWDQHARGLIIGLTRGTERAHVVRATLESTAYQTLDVIEAMRDDSGLELASMRVDGGAVRNDFLCQAQADIVDVEVDRPAVDETTALGAAYAAGLAVGYWEDYEELREHRRVDSRFTPELDGETRERRVKRWNRAVERSGGWAREEER